MKDSRIFKNSENSQRMDLKDFDISSHLSLSSGNILNNNYDSKIHNKSFNNKGSIIEAPIKILIYSLFKSFNRITKRIKFKAFTKLYMISLNNRLNSKDNDLESLVDSEEIPENNFDLEDYVYNDGISLFCFLIESFFKKRVILSKTLFFSNLKVYELHVSIVKYEILSNLNKMLSLRNIFLNLGFSLRMNLRTRFFAWNNDKRLKMKMQNLINMKILNIIRFIIQKKNLMTLKLLAFKKFKQNTNYHRYKERIKSNFITSYRYKITSLYLLIKFGKLKYQRIHYSFLKILRISQQIYKSQQEDLKNRILKFKNFILGDLYEIHETKDKRIIWKEKFKSIVDNPKRVFIHARFIIKLINLYSKNKKLISSFQKLYKNSLRANNNEIRKLLENSHFETQTLKIKKFTYFLVNKFSSFFHRLQNNIMKRTRIITERRFLWKNILYMENYYNNKLLRVVKSLGKIMRLISKRRRKINYSSNNYEKKFVCNSIGNYFFLWKTRIIKIKTLLKIDWNKSFKMLILMNEIYSKLLNRKRKLFFCNLNKKLEYNVKRTQAQKIILQILNRKAKSIKINAFSNLQTTTQTKKFLFKFLVELKGSRKVLFLMNPIIQSFKRKIYPAFLNLKIHAHNNKNIALNVKFELQVKKNLRLLSNFNQEFWKLESCFFTMKKTVFEILKKSFSISKPNLDILIIDNANHIKLAMEKDNKVKNKLNSKFLIISKILRYFHKINSNNSVKYLNNKFLIWKNSVRSVKIKLITENNQLQLNNDHLLNKIKEIENKSTKLEKKLQKCTINAENCELCSHLIFDDGESVLSIEEEAFHNEIHNLQAKTFHEKTNYKSQNNQDKIENKIIPRNSLSVPHNESEDYYSYLMKTYKEMQDKILQIDVDYSNRINLIKSEIGNLIGELDSKFHTDLKNDY